MEKHIVGFNRDRDSYQVAAALAEHGRLAALVTDYYHGRSIPSISALSHRSNELIPSVLVRPVAGALYPQLAWAAARRMRINLKFPARRVDSAIASRILLESRRTPDAGLLIYSNYAWKAFQAAHSSRKTLFQYHPGVGIINQAMEEDELGDQATWQQEVEQTDPRRLATEQIEVELADQVICASEFTARGLVSAGVSREKIAVVPYGCPSPPALPIEKRERVFLFVGQGVQRKGLHQLAEAWRRSSLNGWKLRVVASRMDPEIGRALAGQPNIEVTSSVPKEELIRLYSTSSALVLPSLVEGFGLVLGEALAHGCSLIATDNTGLPDLRLPSPSGRVITPGNVEDLVNALSEHVELFESGLVDSSTNREYAKSRSWTHFRDSIRTVI